MSIAPGCTPGHCRYPYNPSDYEEFPIVPSDTEGMKQAKRLWNASWHECHPTYITGVEGYHILKTYEKEHDILTKLWEEKAKKRPGLFSMYYDEIKQGELFAKEDIKRRTRKPTPITQLVKNYPTTSNVVLAASIAAFAVFFFVTMGPELFIIGTAVTLGILSGLIFHVYRELSASPVIWIQRNTIINHRN